MNVWIAKVTLLVAIAAMIAIRAPYGQKCAKIKVVHSRRGKLEIALLALAWFGSVIFPVIWIATPLLSFADYPLYLASYAAGVVLFLLGLWLFYRSHKDLSTNWSISLDIRENHTLVTSGVYRSIRHPMYAAILPQAIGQALFVPNWIAGPFYLCAFVLLFALRLGPEERMMLDRFGSEYETYMQRSKRLFPGVW
jgi:protein-S-isoprenylcysteine O-methyltransferase Ste14